MKGSIQSKSAVIVSGVLVVATALAAVTTASASDAATNSAAEQDFSLSQAQSAQVVEAQASSAGDGAAIEETSLTSSGSSLDGVFIRNDGLEEELGTISVAPTMHGTSSLVSELVGGDATVLVTPYYTAVLPRTFTSDDFTWEYGEAIEGLPLGAFAPLTVRDSAGNVLAQAFCLMHGVTDDGQVQSFSTTWDAVGNAMPASEIVASVSSNCPDEQGMMDTVLVVPSSSTVSEDAEGGAPYVMGSGSLEQVYGLVQGQASRDAYMAYADQEQQGVRIHAGAYSVLLPQSVLEQAQQDSSTGVGCSYLPRTDYPQMTDALFISMKDAVVSVCQLAEGDEMHLDQGDVVVGTTEDGTSVVISAYTQDGPVDASDYASWVSLAQ